MRRNLLSKLAQWQQRSDRKPLILRGARQVGKTWLVREFAKQNNLILIEMNFEEQPRLAKLFLNNDIQQILIEIERLFQVKVQTQPCLLFLDEIQAAPDILAMLRWFYEKVPEIPVIAAGSLLEFVLEKHDFSMPVGRIEYMHLEPLAFSEFLYALGENSLVDYLNQYTLKETINDFTHEKLIQMFQHYVLIGGMPAAVSSWITQNSVQEVSRIHHNLMATYRDDFNKYAGRLSLAYLETALDAVPRLLGKKFQYSQVSKQLSTTSLNNAVNLLNLARICHKVYHTSANGLPLGGEINEKFFKVIFLDVGLVSAALGLHLSPQINLDNFTLVNRGGIAEQVVGQLFRTIEPEYIEPKLFYWQREKIGSSAEIDYLLPHQGNVLPVEVKAGTTGSLRSLHQFMNTKSLKLACRINADKPSITPVEIKTETPARYTLISLPFYLTEQVHRLVLLPD